MKAIERVCIIGAGSIGSLYAAHLARGVDVVVLTRREEHAERLNAEGLRISGKTEYHATVKATTNPEELGEVDLIILASKTIDVEASIKPVKGQVPNALVMLVQNGLGCEELVARYGNWPILSAVTFMAGTRHSDTHVEYELDTATWLGPWAGGSAVLEDAQRVERLMKESGLVAEAFENLVPAQWSKLIFNAAINSISAITGVPFCEAYLRREHVSDLGHLVYEMMEEGKRVAAASDVELRTDPYEMVEQVGRQYSSEAGQGRVPSMLVDVRNHQPTEIDWLTGAVVRQAVKSEVEVPIHATLYRLVKGLESSWEKS